MSPCDSVQESQCVFSLENTSEDLLVKALANMGFQHDNNLNFHNNNGTSVSFKNGKLITQSRYGATFDQAELKRQYSTEVVKHVSKKYGWKLQEKSKGKFTVIKGY
jgi:hypothetical protein